MKGLPRVCKTRTDWENAVTYAASTKGMSAEMIRRLKALKKSGTMLVLSAGAPTDPEEQKPEHFEPVHDPASPLALSGLSEAEIDAMIKKLGGNV